MSSTSRSQSSSPDILGPPGDADYLISSPIKPFSGRQSWMSPGIVRRQQTPVKRRRVSLSPAKSAHSIRFDDVLLPGSPTMKLDSRQRSLSPEKGPDGNVSPWRIRVTLEATQDEEDENQGRASPSKRRRPSTVTTKIPLKDETSPMKNGTPARKRGRPRKSDVQAQNGSPWPGRASPGNTPGPQEGSTGKKKRGKPRKSTPKPNEPVTLATEDQPSPVPRPSPMDMTADNAGPVEETRSFSPINLAVDDGLESDSLGADDLPIANLRAPTPAHERFDQTEHEFGRATYDTPIIGATEHHFQDNDENINSTPSKMPSPNRERLVSSARSTTRLSHIASSPGTYPSPTPTSSLAEEENHTQEPPVEQYLQTIEEDLETDRQDPESIDQHPETDPVLGPNEENEEFDSIMESEGFTMISLDTLPSVKQRGLGSSTRISTDDSSKILRDRDNGRIGERLKRKLPGTINDLRSDSFSSARPSPASVNVSSGLQRSANPPAELFDLKNQSPATKIAYPELPHNFSPEKSLDSPKRKAFPSLARIVRVGMALQGPFRTGRNEVPGTGSAGRKRRLENIFSSFSPDTQRELRAAIGLGQELAMRRALREDDPADVNDPEPTETQDFGQAMDVESEEEEEEEEEEEDEPALIQSPGIGQNGVSQPSPGTWRSSPVNDVWQQVHAGANRAAEPAIEAKRKQMREEETRLEDQNREAAWQRERDEVSRRANDPINADRFIEIESDEADDDLQFENEEIAEDELLEQSQDSELDLLSDPLVAPRREAEEEQFSEEDDNNFDDIWQQQPEPTPATGHRISEERQPAVEMQDEEDGFDDIWQQEARDHSYLSHESDERGTGLHQDAASPWRQVASRSATQIPPSSSPAYVAIEHGDQNLGPTHIRQLRDQEVDLSALLAEEDTPNRARYFNGTSTPRSILRGSSAAQNSSINGSPIKSSPQKRVRLQPISQSPSPERDVEESHKFHDDSRRSSPSDSSPEKDYDDELPQPDLHGDESDEQQVEEKTMATPEPPRQSAGEPSSWFKRITSLTPRWLQAPQRSRYDSSSDGPEDDQEDEASDQEEPDDIDVHQPTQEDPEPDIISISSQSLPQDPGSPASQGSVAENDREASYASEHPEEENEDAHLPNNQHGILAGPRPLSVFGFFSDAHYNALRRVYRIAKRHPERFPYYDTPGRDQIIGDWMWTSDGRHGLPITEAQFAVIDRFVHELAHADVQYGGSGQVDWTEAELHRRLVSIIIGEQIREERKVKSARGASVDTWR